MLVIVCVKQAVDGGVSDISGKYSGGTLINSNVNISNGSGSDIPLE